MSGTNGRAAKSVLIYLGFSLQLLQVGIIPLLAVIGADLHIAAGSITWLVTASLLSGAIFLAVLTRLADIVGKKKIIILCLVLVLIGSVIGWVANDLTELIVSRVLMGAVLPMLALPEAVAADTMEPDEAQRSISWIHTGTGVGIAAGLLLGTLAGAGDASWRDFFAVGAIASAIGIVATLIWVQESPARAKVHLDIPGAALLSAGLIGLLLAFSEAPTWGWGSARTLAVGIGGIAVLVIWWFVEQHTEQPLISIRHLTMPELRIPYAIIFLVAAGIYGALTAITRISETPASTGFGFGWSTLTTGWFAVPNALGPILGSVLIVNYFTKRGQRVTGLAVGLGVIVIGFILFAVFTTTPTLVLIGLLFDSGGIICGLAITQIIIARAVPSIESGIALGISIVLYALGNTVGSAVVGVFFTSLTIPHTPLPSLDAFHWGFAFGGAAAVVALLLCIPLGIRHRRMAAEGVTGPQSETRSVDPVAA